MTDRELLELAAKAISLPECGWMGPAFMYVKDNRFTDWNPLTDDGDALRLAVKLRLDMLWAEHEKSVVACNDSSNDDPVTEKVRFTHDPYSATRRAIARAAAEIGRVMP